MAKKLERRRTGIRIPRDLDDWLEDLKERHGIPKNHTVQRALEEYRRAHEDGEIKAKPKRSR